MKEVIQKIKMPSLLSILKLVTLSEGLKSVDKIVSSYKKTLSLLHERAFNFTLIF
jgi:hypothetical protein